MYTVVLYVIVDVTSIQYIHVRVQFVFGNYCTVIESGKENFTETGLEPETSGLLYQYI
jgi:hypothetical protein